VSQWRVTKRPLIKPKNGPNESQTQNGARSVVHAPDPADGRPKPAPERPLEKTGGRPGPVPA